MNNMELKEGMHVRTKRGYIYKLSYYEGDNNRWISFEENDWYPVYESSVTKASHNIIDLIEVGDYVNGEKITRVIPQDICGYEVLDYQHIFVNDREIFKEDIKSIVTKEMFANAEYKVGD